MTEDVYRKLALRLDDNTPNGYPATESGVELRLLEKIFEADEAALAAVMQADFEPAADIAARVGLDSKDAYRKLKGMARKGLIYIKKGQGQLLFALMPFAVGFYEEQLPRMDVEMAQLFEEYFHETLGISSINLAPSIHRVIPVTEAIPANVEIAPYAHVVSLVEEAKAWGVRQCICRLQQQLVGQACEHSLDNCINFAPVAGAFDHSEVTRAITKEEALQILQQAAQEGLVHSVANHRDEHFYICNCCTCSCGVLRSVTEFGNLTAVAHSDFLAVVDEDECIACGDCVEMCQFGALAVPDDVCVVETMRCMGCGVCIATCPSDALRLVRRPEDDILPLAKDLQEWGAQRLQQRKLATSDAA